MSGTTILVDRPASIPAEYRGRARDLIRRLRMADIECVALSDRAAGPLARRLKRHPVQRKEDIDAFIAAFRRMPKLGEISLDVTRERQRVRVILFRAMSAKQTLDGWRDHEAAIAITCYSAWIMHSEFDRLSWRCATVSLHAMARFFERSPEPTDEALIRSLGPLTIADPVTGVANDGSFAIAAIGGGEWLGKSVRDHESRRLMLAVRTYR